MRLKWLAGRITRKLYCEPSLIREPPRDLFVRRSADDPGETTIAAGEGGRDSELLLHCGRSTAAPDTLAKERQENLT